MLVNAPTPEARQAVADYIEDQALQEGRLIESQTQMDPAARDAHCAAYRKSHRERGALARPLIRRGGLRARRGRVAVQVACPAGLRICDGTLSLDRVQRRVSRRRAVTARLRKPRRLAGVALPEIGPGGTQVVHLTLSRRARRALRRRHRLRIRATVRTTSPWGLQEAKAAGGRLRARRR
jgi:hypothetical protein